MLARGILMYDNLSENEKRVYRFLADKSEGSHLKRNVPSSF